MTIEQSDTSVLRDEPIGELLVCSGDIDTSFNGKPFEIKWTYPKALIGDTVEVIKPTDTPI